MRRFLQIHLSLFLILAASAVRECEGTAERGEGGGGAGAVLEILRPQHHTVVRTQSVEIAVISSPGNDVTIHVDGKLISTVPGGRQFSVILAEEGFLSEGIHEVTVRKQVAGKIEERSSTFQFARDFQPSEFGHTEIFVFSPHGGELLATPLPEEGALISFNVSRKDVREELVAAISLDGEILLEYLIQQDALMPVEVRIRSIMEGRHDLQIMVYDKNDNFTGAEALVPFEVAEWLEGNSESTGGTRCDVTIGILASQPALKGEGANERMAGSRTLARTLAALSGLRNSIAEVIVYVQERDEDLMSVAERFTDRVYGFDRRIGKGNAWLYLATAAKCKHVLFLEDDFVLIEDQVTAASRLRAAVNLLEAGTADAVRLRHRKRPGEPLWVEKTLRSRGEIAESHSLHRVHFEAFTRGNGVERCEKGSEYYCADSSRAEYTNNPVMYRTDWVRTKGGRGLGEMLSRDDYNTMERRVSSWWSKSGTIVAQGMGLFEHARIDGFEEDKQRSRARTGAGGAGESIDEVISDALQGKTSLEPFQIRVLVVWGGNEGQKGVAARHVAHASDGVCGDGVSFDIVSIGGMNSLLLKGDGDWGALRDYADGYDVVHVVGDAAVEPDMLKIAFAQHGWPLLVSMGDEGRGDLPKGARAEAICRYEGVEDSCEAGKCKAKTRGRAVQVDCGDRGYCDVLRELGSVRFWRKRS